MPQVLCKAQEEVSNFLMVAAEPADSAPVAVHMFPSMLKCVWSLC
jgi:hypothetical protein